MTHLRSLTSSHGGVELRQSTSVHGLRQMMLDAWTPNDRRTFAVFLEDDVEVSPHFLEYAEQMVGGTCSLVHPVNKARRGVWGSVCIIYGMRR
ncbi:hypothetical protein BC829DRAFT_135465 [Chytridium lagenaria]|nr:hypothetical protein BC829DRAFT_135465 [Chytridium lagenaria]